MTSNFRRFLLWVALPGAIMVTGLAALTPSAIPDPGEYPYGHQRVLNNCSLCK